MSHHSSSTWLKAFACLVAGLGLVLAMGAHPATAWGANLLLDMVFWPLDGTQRIDSEAARLLAAMGGGGFVGLGVMVWRNALALKSGASSAAMTITLGMLGWCVVDSVFSAAAGAPLNVLLNLGVLALFLSATLKHVGRPDTRER
jgi:hypothetical protein